MKKFLLNVSLVLFDVGLIFVKFPSFIFIFVSTHLLSRVLLLIASVIMFVVSPRKALPHKQIALLLFLLIAASLSIIGAVNIESFFASYKDMCFAILISVILISTEKAIKLQHIIKVLFLAVALNVIVQVAFLFSPETIGFFFRTFLNEKSLEIFDYQLSRNRFFGDMLDEAFIPILISTLYLGEKKEFRAISIALIAALSIVTFISGWRTKLIILCFELFISLTLLVKGIKSKLIFSVLFLSVLMFVATSNSLLKNTTNTLNRVFLTENEYIKTVQTRLSYWKNAFDLYLTSPIVGVGLGNYYDNLNQVSKNNNKSGGIDRFASSIVIDDPHNILFSMLSSMGILALAGFLFFLIEIIKDDFKEIFTNAQNQNRVIFILIFWGYFLYAFMNPWQNYGFIFYFFLLRALISYKE